MSWEMTKQEDPGVSLSTKMTLQQAGADRTPDRNSPASRREVNAEVGGFGGFWHFIAWLQPPASSLQSSSGGEGGLSSGTLQLPGEKFMPRQGGSGGLWHFVAWLQPPASSLQSSSGGEGGLSCVACGASVGRRSQF